MGEFADMMLAGILCDRCGTYIDDQEPGHPRLCEECKNEEDPFENI